MTNTTQKLLIAWAGALTLAFAVVVLTGATSGRSQAIDTLDVQRINVREPDGTLRMVISGRDRFPGAIFGDREYTHPREAAGMLFFNDEGMENGGLIFGGSKDGDGGPDSGGHLSFDPYDRDQAVALSQIESDGIVRAGLTVNDTGSQSIEALFQELERIQALPESEREAAREALFEARRAGGQGSARRVFVGKDREQVSTVLLADAAGRPRLRLRVTPEGAATIEFLDADGKVLRTLASNDPAEG